MKRAGELLHDFFGDLGIPDQNNFGGFYRAWPIIAGEKIRAHARPHDFRNGVLILAVDHPGWMSRIKFEEERIVKAIAKEFPDLGVRSIAYFAVDSFEELSRAGEGSGAEPPPDADSHGLPAHADSQPEGDVAGEKKSSDTHVLDEALKRLKSAIKGQEKNRT